MIREVTGYLYSLHDFFVRNTDRRRARSCLLVQMKLEVSSNIYSGIFALYTCYKSTSWRAERALFGREAADRERHKYFFESLIRTLAIKILLPRTHSIIYDYY